MDLQIGINKDSLTMWMKLIGKIALISVAILLATLLVNLFFAPIIFKIMLLICMIITNVLIFITLTLAIAVLYIKFKERRESPSEK